MTFLYGGDEVGAVVLDVGSSSTRAGWAGEDGPRSVFPSAVGLSPVRDGDGDMVMGNEEKAPQADGEAEERTKTRRKRRPGVASGDVEVNSWKAGMEIKTPLKDGLVEDWDTLEALWDHAFYHSLDTNPAEHPLLVTETAWNSPELRERLTELAFEKYGVPAFFVAKDAVLAAFAAGKSNGLVVSCGSSMTSVVPIYEGYALKKGAVKQSLAGNAVSEFALQLLKARYELDVVPQYLVKSKEVTTAGQQPKFAKRDLANTTESFHRHHMLRAVNDWKETVCQVSEYNYDENAASSRPAKSYEFPNGYNNPFGKERFEAPELLFNPRRFMPNAGDLLTLPQMLTTSVASCDVDLRTTLWSNVILTGGTTSLPGFPDRLSKDLYSMIPGLKLRLNLSSNSTERKHGAWIGGSILASLGTFQQLWISKQEYSEHGPSIVEKRCN